MIIGIVGLPGSGKTSLSGIMKRRGFKVLEMGDIVRKGMAREGVPLTGPGMREYANALKSRHGKDWIAKEAMKEISMRRLSGKDFAVSSIRTPEEVLYFRRRLRRMVIIGLVAPPETRFRRLMRRGRKDDPKSRKGFELRERKESGWRTPEAVRMADYVLCNTGTIADLRTGMDEVLKNLKGRKK